MSKDIEKVEKEFEDRDGFPIEVFPKWISDFITEYQTKRNWPVESSSVGALVGISSSAGANKTLDIQWTSRPSLFCCIIGRPGSNKTHPLNNMLKPITEKNDALISSYSAELKIFNALGKRDKETNPKPEKKQIETSDTTIEALAELLSYNTDGILIHKDELSGFFKDLNRYSSGGGDVEKILETFTHQPITINRKGDERIINVPNPVINLVGTTQPLVFASIAKKGEFHNNGLLDRILFANINMVPTELSDVVLNTNLEINYQNKLKQILYNRGQSVTYALSDDARKAYYEATNTLTRRIGEVNESWAGVLSKLQTYLPRFILILHIADNTDQQKKQITRATVINAYKLCLYFEYQALMTRKNLKNGDKYSGFDDRQLRFIKSLPNMFTTEVAITIGEKLHISSRTVESWIGGGTAKFKKVVRRVKRGQYKLNKDFINK